MFGYVLPVREKLTAQQWQDYRAAYCGLCHTLKQRYGFLARFLLNYDFTFLALLLRREEEAPCVSCRRCVSAPLRGRDASEPDSSLEAAADISVLLIYWKLKDQLVDERGLRRIPALVLLALFQGVFRRGREQNPTLHQEIGRRLSRLQQLEQEGCSSIDRMAEQFALIMTAMVPQDWDEPARRVMEQLLYHLGRWIYLIDAWDDLDEDLKHNRYNPVASRYQLTAATSPEVREEARQSMDQTVCHSENLAISAFHLETIGYHTPVVENILCAGLQSVRHLVFSGEWKKYRKQKKQELKQT